MKFLVILSALLINISCFGQTPFVQQNNSKQKTLIKLDTTDPKLKEQIDALVKNIDKFTLPNASLIVGDSLNTSKQIQELSDALKKKSTEYDDLKSTKDKIEEQADNLTATIKKLAKDNAEKKKLQGEIDELNKHIKSLEDNLKDREAERDDLKKKLDNFQQSLDQAVFEKYVLASNTTGLQFAVFENSIEQSNAAIKQLETSLNTLDEGVTQPPMGDVIVTEADKKVVRKMDVQMIRDVQGALTTMNEIKKDLKALNDQLQAYKDTRQRLSVLISIGRLNGLNDVLSKELKKEEDQRNDIEAKIKNLKETIGTAQTQITALDTKINDNKSQIERIQSAYKTNKETPEENLKTIAGITQPLSEDGKLVPNISVLGFKGVSDENSITAAQFKLFVSPTSTEKNILNSTYRLFIPEASSYGFMADFSFGFIPSTRSYKLNTDTKQPVKKVGLNLSAYYLGKNLVRSKDSSTFTTGMLQFKTGLQYVAIGRTLSLYANMNPFFLTDGVQNFKENFNYHKGLQSFVDFGLNCYLNLSQDKANGFFIDFDLGFIVAGRDVKSIVPTDDPLIPRLKVALVKGFAF